MTGTNQAETHALEQRSRRPSFHSEKSQPSRVSSLGMWLCTWETFSLWKAREMLIGLLV